MPTKIFVVDGIPKKSFKNKTTDLKHGNRSGMKKQILDKNGLYQIMKLPIIVAQCCGLFPVIGIAGESPDHVRFRWLSWRTFYAIFCISGNITMAVFFYYWVAVRGFRLENMGSLVFYSTSLICTILFLKLGRAWPKISREWTVVETKFASYPNIKSNPRKYKVILIVILLIALVEHTLAVAVSFGWLSQCTDENLAIMHIKADFPQWFCFIKYDHFKALLAEYFNWVSTFNWNFNDIFIILVSEALTAKFKQLNAQIKFAQVNVITDNFYQTIREDYTLLSQFCDTLNKAISHIVTLSFMSNILHICIQLYNILRPRDNLIEYTYFYYSLCFLLGRAIAVSVYASSINEESKYPLVLLNSVPSSWYNVEVSRLIQQINTLSVSLTGSNFFFVTRSLLISVGGTIIAYELVLVQLPRPLSKADIFLRNATDSQKRAFICNISRLCEH